MSDLILSVRAPSNIALIKYMGKKDSVLNLPENSSLSMTLNSLCTVAEIRISKEGSGSVRWVPEKPELFSDPIAAKYPMVVPPLKDHGIGKVIRHFERVQRAIPEIFSQFGIEYSIERWKTHDFVLRTGNTFPASSGIASSASAFAALTLASATALAAKPIEFEKAWKQNSELKRALARISRQGSGSSCRSFEGPWVLWQEERAAEVQASQMPALAHFVVLVRTEPKKVSSSDAHTLIKTSPLWEGRVNRVEERTCQLIAALQGGDVPSVARIAWAESWEMHSLFHTCAEPFTYWEPGTVDGLQWFGSFFQDSGEMAPPIVTLDAGPNIHVMVEQKYREVWRERLRSHFKNGVILEDEQGEGASIIEMKGEIRGISE